MSHDAVTTDRGSERGIAVAALALGAVLTWAWWPSLREMSSRWMTDPRYSHGLLVPAFSAFLLWHRRGLLAEQRLTASWWGVLIVAAGTVLMLAGARLYFGWVESVSLLVALTGVGLVLGGPRLLRWAWPSIGFLFFMVPLPYRAEVALGAPLQRIATVASNYLLQTMGLPAVAEGNVILLSDARIGVVDACNGLGMLFMFAAFAVGLTLIASRPLLDKAIILFSAIPIALAANIARITVTGLLHETAGGVVADTVYHDLAGWLMMPLALAALWVELFVLSKLFINVAPEPPIPVGLFMVPPSGPRRDGRPR